MHEDEPCKSPVQELEEGNPSPESIAQETPRKSSFFTPLFENFHWSKHDSAVILPVHESVPPLQEGLADVEEDPDFVEVEIKPKAGSVSRRASLIANIFSSKDIDVDPDLEFEPSASEAQIKQGVAEAQSNRTHRKMIYSRNAVATSFVVFNTICIALSFGLISVWYALIPLILAAPFLHSVMALDLLGFSAYSWITTSRQAPTEPGVPNLNLATVLSFKDETFEDVKNCLDAIVDQQDIDQHKHMLLVFANDQMLNEVRAKSTTRVLLEHAFTNIADEAKFQIPREDDEYEFTTLWCRRGIYKSLPYILVVKEGVVDTRERLGSAREMLYGYNCRHEALAKTPAFNAWFQEWAEQHGFASFDFLISTSPDTTLHPNCISELCRQSLADPKCVGTSSLVKVDTRTHKWSLGNLYRNASYMRDQLVRKSHQSNVSRQATAAPGACQMLKICEQTCGPQVMKDLGARRPSPMGNIVSKIRSFADDDSIVGASYGPGVITRQAMGAIAYTRPSSTFSEFVDQHQQLSLSDLASNLSVLSNNHSTWFEKLSSFTEILAWSLPLFSLAIIANFLRAAALHQNIPVLIVLGAVVTLPWIYSSISSMFFATSWQERFRYLLGFLACAVLSPFMVIIATASAIMNLHHLGQRKAKRARHAVAEAEADSSNV